MTVLKSAQQVLADQDIKELTQIGLDYQEKIEVEKLQVDELPLFFAFLIMRLEKATIKQLMTQTVWIKIVNHLVIKNDDYFDYLGELLIANHENKEKIAYLRQIRISENEVGENFFAYDGVQQTQIFKDKTKTVKESNATIALFIKEFMRKPYIEFNEDFFKRAYYLVKNMSLSISLFADFVFDCLLREFIFHLANVKTNMTIRHNYIDRFFTFFVKNSQVEKVQLWLVALDDNKVNTYRVKVLSVCKTWLNYQEFNKQIDANVLAVRESDLFSFFNGIFNLNVEKVSQTLKITNNTLLALNELFKNKEMSILNESKHSRLYYSFIFKLLQTQNDKSKRDVLLNFTPEAQDLFDYYFKRTIKTTKMSIMRYLSDCPEWQKSCVIKYLI